MTLPFILIAAWTFVACPLESRFTAALFVLGLVLVGTGFLLAGLGHQPALQFTAVTR